MWKAATTDPGVLPPIISNQEKERVWLDIPIRVRSLSNCLETHERKTRLLPNGLPFRDPQVLPDVPAVSAAEDLALQLLR